MNTPFDLLDPTRPPSDGAERLASRTLPRTLGNLAAAAEFYQPDPDLVDAVNVALAIGAPLLLTGEPGTGKTQVAYYLAHYFGVSDELFELPVRSSTTAEDLLYTFDAVAYLHAAYVGRPDPKKPNGESNQSDATTGDISTATSGATPSPADRDCISKADFIHPGPLWKAYDCDGRCVVLIDEIDKAPRDFPNDLLHVLDQHYFDVRETGQRKAPADGSPPPIIIITSNSERRLPEPFLRRCVFYHIEFDEKLVRRAVEARGGDFPHLNASVQDAAILKFLDLRAQGLRKPPATAELLAWLAVLSARGTSAEELSVPLAKLPALAALIKDREDYERLS